MLEHHRIGPGSETGHGHFLALGKQRRQGFFLFQPTGNQGGIAINVGTHLQHRRLAVTTGQGYQVGLGHDRRDQD
ncbi:hypothetical protein D3C85_1164060 [compost metagenome]